MAQLHLGPTHVRIRPLNSRKLIAVLSSLGKLLHTRADSNLNDLCPYVTVLTVGILTVFSYLKEFFVCLTSTNLLVRTNSFSNRVVDSWNSLTEDIVNAPSLNAFKSRLNRFWRGHPYNFSPSCYSPGQHIRDRTQNQNAPEEANGPN